MFAPVPPEVAFDYLVDPHHRPAWQSSLRRVEDVTGEPRVGQTWVDVTAAGVRPRMRTTELDRPDRWTEEGHWRSFRATLTLTFTAVEGGCEIGVAMDVAASGPAGLLARGLSAVAPRAVRSDLKRAVVLMQQAV